MKINNYIKYLPYVISICLSIIGAFLSSSLQNLFLPTKISIIYFFLGWLLISSIFMKIRFKSNAIFKIFLFRKLLKINSLFNVIDNNLSFEKVELSKLQMDSVNLWNFLLKQKGIELNACITSKYRIIKRGNMILYLRNSEDSNLTVVDNTDSNIFYQVFIPQKISSEMETNFDSVQTSNFEQLINEKQSFLSNIIKTKL